MSHIIVREAEHNEHQICSLDTLERAAQRCDMSLKRNVNQQIYGRHCPHALQMADVRYRGQIGLGESAKFPGTFAMVYDSDYSSRVAELSMYHEIECAREIAMANGDLFTETKLPDGSIIAECDTSVRLGV